MNAFKFEPGAKKISFDADNMGVVLTDGRQLGVPPACFPRLLNASREQRGYYMLIGGGSGIQWDELDENISAKEQ